MSSTDKEGEKLTLLKHFLRQVLFHSCLAEEVWFDMKLLSTLCASGPLTKPLFASAGSPFCQVIDGLSWFSVWRGEGVLWNSLTITRDNDFHLVRGYSTERDDDTYNTLFPRSIGIRQFQDEEKGGFPSFEYGQTEKEIEALYCWIPFT